MVVTSSMTRRKPSKPFEKSYDLNVFVVLLLVVNSIFIVSIDLILKIETCLPHVVN